MGGSSTRLCSRSDLLPCWCPCTVPTVAWFVPPSQTEPVPSVFSAFLLLTTCCASSFLLRPSQRQALLPQRGRRVGFASCKSSSPNHSLGPLKAERGTEGGGCSHQFPLLQLLHTQDPLPGGAMEGEVDNQQNVVKLVAVFEEHCRDSKFAWRDNQAPHSQTTAAASQPQQLPASPARRSLSPRAARLQGEQEQEEEQQGQHGLSFKCLRSLRHKIREDNWRRPQGPGLEPGKEEPEEKKIALELLETEQAYVNRLHLLDQVFYTELMKEAKTGKTVPEEVVKMIFSNISSIHQFHSEFFLPELLKRMEDWNCNPRIGDVIQKLAPFLKMYGEYVKNFDKAVELITAWSEKSPPFQELIADIQKRKVCANLTLQHHMLEPVQRIPRYELLLKDYVRKLPPESPDRGDAEKALEMIFMVAKHSNAAIAEMERLQNLWVVYQRLGLEDDIVDPSNQLIKEGPIQKVSTRNNSTSEKYLFLFNNMLLYCVPKVIQVGAEFQVRLRMDVDGMKVWELKDAEFPHTFLVSGKQRTLQLQARSGEEMDAWIKAFQDAIDRKEKRSETFKTAVPGLETDTPALKTEELGRRAPQWVRDNLVTMCMRCREPFNAITRRRHHCRACGYVVCARCSDYKAELQYDGNRLNRVCQECYIFLTGHAVLEDREGKHKGILEKGAAEVSSRSLLCSSLQLLDKNGKGGTRGWFVIPQDDPLVLYVYAAPQDVRAHTSIPLLGYQVKDLPQSDSRHLFQLAQSRQVHTFLADTEELKRRWMRAMARSAAGITHPEDDEEDADPCDKAE
ncbi:FYVE, RhoGEF and PH domain-containing protein 2 isoform X2 [Corapipo altera]|uniref:FYVE, RhoGEF and PH domain-containing protein 2 isoform X2 n=1 Tax=Corapipo altera TaxID=415028 RepID=UPI000FD66723|nr:FYVE, RhoGEF and PH domain-containing protein 2 isoform X2 [Corapipo altera]